MKFDCTPVSSTNSSYLIKLPLLSIKSVIYFTPFLNHDRQLVKPDLPANCFHRLSADDKSSFTETDLTLNVPITTKVVCFSRLLNCLGSLYGKQCGPRSDCSQSVLGPRCLLLYLIRHFLQQTTSVDNIFKCIFSWRFKG